MSLVITLISLILGFIGVFFSVIFGFIGNSWRAIGTFNSEISLLMFTEDNSQCVFMSDIFKGNWTEHFDIIPSFIVCNLLYFHSSY